MTVNQLHTNKAAVATPTGRPKFVHKRGVIERFGGISVLPLNFLKFSSW